MLTRLSGVTHSPVTASQANLLIPIHTPRFMALESSDSLDRLRIPACLAQHPLWPRKAVVMNINSKVSLLPQHSVSAGCCPWCKSALTEALEEEMIESLCCILPSFPESRYALYQMPLYHFKPSHQTKDFMGRGSAKPCWS